MNKILILMLSVITASALEWHTTIQYVTKDDPTAKWTLQDDGQGVYIQQWQAATAKPTKAALEAAEPAALVWKAEQVKDQIADLEAMDDKMKTFLKALVICINKRLPAGEKITLTELRTEARALAGE